MLTTRGVARLTRKAAQASRANAAFFSTLPALVRAAQVPVAQRHHGVQKSNVAQPGR